MPQLEHIEAIEKRLWTAADTLRANSNYASNEYFLPVMGLVFLRHAYSRYLGVKDSIEANLPKRGGKTRALSKEDFSQQSAIFLQPRAQFDTLVALTDSDDRARAIIEAMDSIESDYENLRGVLPKSEYQELDNAVHGLEGDIQKAISYYEDPHELLGKANYVMANPPFNVDEIDADKVKNDPRLPFGLPGVNKKGGVSNGNYIWISYFYSYLNKQGRAGFVMSAQASSAGRDEARVRQKLVETGDVDIMIAIRSNFFYTRTVPCELWFFDRDKPSIPSPPSGERARVRGKDTVLMLDARNIYRKVTRKIYDFSPEQEQNLLAIVWLYRGEADKYLELVASYCCNMLDDGAGCFSAMGDDGEESETYDISKIDFDRLRKEFERSPAKRTTVQNLKQAIETRLQRLMAQNPLRTDFQQHYENIVAEYNREKDRVTIEKTFEVLLRFVGELDEEDSRALREGLDEESLAIFDLIKKPGLNAADLKRIKAVAAELLARLKQEKLRIDHWRDKESTRDAVRVTIRDHLWSDDTGLPVDAYTEDDVDEKSEEVFRHVYRAYPKLPSPFYASPG